MLIIIVADVKSVAENGNYLIFYSFSIIRCAYVLIIVLIALFSWSRQRQLEARWRALLVVGISPPDKAI